MDDFLRFLVDNWDVLGLIFTNIIALFVEPPLRRKE